MPGWENYIALDRLRSLEVKARRYTRLFRWQEIVPNGKAVFLACIDIPPVTNEYKWQSASNEWIQIIAGSAVLVRRSFNSYREFGTFSISLQVCKGKTGEKIRWEKTSNSNLSGGNRPFPADTTRQRERTICRPTRLAVINLEEAGQNQELGDGSLYTKLQRKLPQSMLARYHRWIFVTHAEESVMTLWTWVIQESQFQTVVSETVNGVTGKTMGAAITQPVPGYKSPRTVYREQRNKEIQNLHCPICEADHVVSSCQDFRQRDSLRDWT